MSAHKKVFLTGASGFLAAHVLEQLVEQGYAVKATVRSQAKADYILARYKGKPVEVVIVPDIQDPHAFDVALDGDHDITAVVHTASPFFMAKTDPLKELLEPAVKGTTHVLQAIKKHAPQVTQVVITSSYAAISNVNRATDPTFHVNEDVWANITWDQAVEDLTMSYRGSKKFAEEAFWEYIEKEKPNFTGTTINPPLIYGPLIQHVEKVENINTSSKLVYDLLHEKVEDPKTYSERNFLWVDVRDVAIAHVTPLSKPAEYAGKRLLVTPGYIADQDILDLANKEFPALKGKIPTGNPGTGSRNADKTAKLDNSRTNKLLGIKYISFEKSLKETIDSLLELDEKLGTSL